MKVITKNIEETRSFAKDILANLKNLSNATVLALYGDLGSGKTTFAQGIAEALEVKENVTSPTFVIMKRFTIHDSRFSNIIHIDAYRLSVGKELETLGFNELCVDPKNLILIEWPERVKDIVPKDAKKIFFTFIDETTREIEFAN